MRVPEQESQSWETFSKMESGVAVPESVRSFRPFGCWARLQAALVTSDFSWTSVRTPARSLEGA